MQKQKIRIRLKSYEISLLNESCEKIIDTASRIIRKNIIDE